VVGIFLRPHLGRISRYLDSIPAVPGGRHGG